jgi:hypothetical protein
MLAALGARMVLTKEELVASLQNEVRILLHLVSKIDRSQLNYRPTPNQRSTLELLRYLSVMGPELIAYVRSGAFDRAAWQASLAAADRLNFDQVIETLGRQATRYADLISEFSEADFRGEVEMFFRKASRGSIIVNIVLCGCAAYRAQLFLYLKACGREELSTWNLWAGVDAVTTA